MSNLGIARRAARQESNLARGASIARRASTILKRAGHVKAGRYHPFAPQDPGYDCSEHGNGSRPVATAAVSYIDGRPGHRPDEAHAARLAEYAELLEERFNVTTEFGRILTLTNKEDLT